MNRERLNKMTALLDNYKGDDGPEFDLESWGEYEVRRGGFLWLQKLSCDTAACAVGLACLSGAFARDGLGYRRMQQDCDITPVFSGYAGWGAVQHFFDLTPKQAFHLFDPDSYSGPTKGAAGARAVADRIRKLMAPRKRKPKRSGAPQVFVEMIKPDKIERAMASPELCEK